MTGDRKYGTAERQPLREEPTWEQVLQKNTIERLKKEKAPVGIVHEVPELASRNYLDISEEDIVRLQWYGLYHDKPKVGAFMMRIKLPSGICSPEQFRTLGRLSVDIGR